jgi:cell wall-associated NlpC family hydrolase
VLPRLPSPLRGPIVAGFVGLATLTGAGCASHGTAVPQPFPQPFSASAPAASAPDPRGDAALAQQLVVQPLLGSAAAEGVVSVAMHLLGTRYRNGGSNPDGFDCSGFVQYVFAQQGVLVPRTVEEQARYGLRVEDDVRAGDLVFFHTSGSGPSHVGIALDNTRFVHAPSSRGEVRVEPLARPYWADRFIEARRMIANAPAP